MAIHFYLLISYNLKKEIVQWALNCRHEASSAPVYIQTYEWSTGPRRSVRLRMAGEFIASIQTPRHAPVRSTCLSRLRNTSASASIPSPGPLERH